MVFIFVFLLNSFLFSQPTKKPLPPITKVVSKLRSAADAIPHHYVSHAMPADPSGYLQSGKDITQVEYEVFTDWIKKAKKPQVDLIRFHFSNPKFAEGIFTALDKRQFPISLVTDLNEAFELKPTVTEPHTFNFAEDASAKSNALGKTIQAFLDHGFKYFDPIRGIFSHPLFKLGPNERKPLMHQKDLLLRDEGNGPSLWLSSTANATAYQANGNPFPITRFNRLLLITDPAAIAFAARHTQAMKDAFLNHQLIRGIEFPERLEIKYQNGEKMEIAFTDGKYNLNDRQLESLAKNVKRIWHSHYVLTHKELVKQTKARLKNSGIPLFGVYDDTFLDLDGYGLASTLDGYIQMLPYGQNEKGVSDKVEQQTELYVYMRQIPNSIEEETEGPPISRHLWHDKTTVYEIEENGETYFEVYTLSFNASNNFHNAETQVKLTLRPESPLLKSIVASIESARNDRYAIPMPLAVLHKSVVNKLLEKSVFNVPLEASQQLYQLIRRRYWNKVREKLREIARIPSTLKRSQKVTQDELDARCERFVEYLKWNDKTFPRIFTSSADTPFRRMLLATILLSKAVPPAQAFDAIYYSLFDPSQAENNKLRLERVQEVWDLLGLEKEALTPLLKGKVDKCSQAVVSEASS